MEDRRGGEEEVPVEGDQPGLDQIALLQADDGPALAADVQTYPTWVFSDGSRVSEVIPLRELADRVGYRLAAVPAAAETGGGSR